MANWPYRFLGLDYTVFSVMRKPGLPYGYALADMAGEYTAMIRTKFGGPAAGKQLERDVLTFLRER